MHAGVYELKVSVCMDKGGCVSVFACTLVECKGGFGDVVNQLGIRICMCVCVLGNLSFSVCVCMCCVFVYLCVSAQIWKPKQSSKKM